MYWQENTEQTDLAPSAQVVDMVFRMRCECLPLDHAYALSQAICHVFPWFQSDQQCGIHAVHGAEFSHGWHRPTEGEARLVRLSRRVRLVLRVPYEKVSDCAALSEQTLNVSDQSLEVGEFRLRKISPSPTLFARTVLGNDDEPEQKFVHRVYQDLEHLQVTVPKLLPGQRTTLRTSTGVRQARSLLLADVNSRDSVRIQETGLGVGRSLGCGIFVPHKSIASLDEK